MKLKHMVSVFIINKMMDGNDIYKYDDKKQLTLQPQAIKIWVHLRIK